LNKRLLLYLHLKHSILHKCVPVCCYSVAAFNSTQVCTSVLCSCVFLLQAYSTARFLRRCVPVCYVLVCFRCRHIPQRGFYAGVYQCVMFLCVLVAGIFHSEVCTQVCTSVLCSCVFLLQAYSTVRFVHRCVRVCYVLVCSCCRHIPQ